MLDAVSDYSVLLAVGIALFYFFNDPTLAFHFHTGETSLSGNRDARLVHQT